MNRSGAPCGRRRERRVALRCETSVGGAVRPGHQASWGIILPGEPVFSKFPGPGPHLGFRRP